MCAARGEEVVAAIKSTDGAAIAIEADVTNASDVEQLSKTALNAFGRVDVVVHTAGIMPMSKIADGDLEIFDKER
jgi:3-oxoacyl-[acyl-carrier protein] reductase